MFAKAVFTKENIENAIVTTHLETKDYQTSTTKYSKTNRVSRQKLLEPLFVTAVIVTKKKNGLLYFSLTANLPQKGVCLTKAL